MELKEILLKIVAPLLLLGFVTLLILVRRRRNKWHWVRPPLDEDDINFIDKNIEEEKSHLTEDDKQFIKEYTDEMNK